MIEQGTDPLMLVCQRAQQRGFQFLPSLLLNMIHTPHDRVTNCRVADFTTEHPEWQVGEEPRVPPRPASTTPTGYPLPSPKYGQTGWQ